MYQKKLMGTRFCNCSSGKAWMDYRREVVASVFEMIR